MARKFITCSQDSLPYRLYNGDLAPTNYFGDVEADSEWREDDIEASGLFVHTASYDVAKQENSLFIFGRRGTGKTALLKMMEREIKEEMMEWEKKSETMDREKKVGSSPRYSYCKTIGQKKVIRGLTIELRNNAGDHSREDLIEILRSQLIWVIYTSAMVSIVEHHRDLWFEDERIFTMLEYLNSLQLIQIPGNIAITPIEHNVSTFSRIFREYNKQGISSSKALADSFDSLNSSGFQAALKAAIQFLFETDTSALVLIDSQELYNFDDHLSEAAISALMDAVLEVYHDRHWKRIHSKVAFPSEIYPHLQPENKGKIVDKMHFIFWKYRDLVALISKRYAKVLVDKEYFRRRKDIPNVDNPQVFLSKFFPPKTLSFCDIEFDTIPYILSHTQMKPREIILLFNVILTLADKNGIQFDKLNADCIREGTNARIEDLSASVLDMYRSIYPNAPEIVRQTFTGSNNIITFGELDDQLKEANSLFNKRMTRENAKRLFLETGIIGIVQQETEAFGDKRFIEAIFEYQRKDVLAIQSKHLLAIHPMFYQEFIVNVDRNSLVYPKPSEEEQEAARRLEMSSLSDSDGHIRSK